MVIPQLDLSDACPMWPLPGTRTKNGQPNNLPLPAPVVQISQEVIGDRSDGTVFQAADGRFVGEHTIRQAIQRLFDKVRLTIPHFTPHDIRPATETGMAHPRISKEVRDKILNHKDTSVAGRHYDRHDYIDQTREALENWPKHLSRLRSQ